MIRNPKVVVEVLSDSTERFDRGEKFVGYRSLPSLADSGPSHGENFAIPILVLVRTRSLEGEVLGLGEP